MEQRNLWTKSVCLSATEIAPADGRAEKDYCEELNRDGLGGPRKSFAHTHLSDARTLLAEVLIVNSPFSRTNSSSS